eukprot:7151399-Prymnesium_polylepis.3
MSDTVNTRLLRFMASKKPLKCWSVTLAQNCKPLPDPTQAIDIMDEFFVSWTFQLEEGHTAGKEHYQGRVVIEPPQMTQTLLHLFESRGIDKRGDWCYSPA